MAATINESIFCSLTYRVMDVLVKAPAVRKEKRIQTEDVLVKERTRSALPNVTVELELNRARTGYKYYLLMKFSF